MTMNPIPYDAARNAKPPGDEPTVPELIAAIQARIGKAEYRLRIDAKRRPDGKTITKSMRQCIDELYSELEN